MQKNISSRPGSPFVTRGLFLIYFPIYVRFFPVTSKSFMQKTDRQNKITAFFSTTWGMIILFVIIFYSMTFLVYYFYSPGPEERRMAQQEKNEPPPVVPAANQLSSIKVENDLIPATQQTAVQTAPSASSETAPAGSPTQSSAGNTAAQAQ